MNLTCTYDELSYTNLPINYRCEIIDQLVYAEDIQNVIGSHINNKSNADVLDVTFQDCNMRRVPQGLTKIFPNMKTLNVFRSNLKNIKKEDLVEYKLLQKLDFSINHIEFLPADLFDGFENLQEISFIRNKLKIIEPNIFDGLVNLSCVNLKLNPSYSSNYENSTFKNAKLNNLKAILQQVFLQNIQLYKTFIRAEIEPEKQLFTDIKNILQDDSHKDFKVLIGDREFPVHKLILAARSPTLAEILKNNPEVENLSLYDIPVATFEIILNYIYSAEFPRFEEYDQLSLYAASGRFKIEELKNFVATDILEQINDKNALDILKLSNKYEHLKLKQKSFSIIKKKYPKLKFKDQWIEAPGTVCIIIEKFEEKEEIIRKAEEDFENERESM